MTPNFSIVLIARNEEKTLPNMLKSLKPFFDRGGDVVVMDTGSTDLTAKIAEEAGCNTIRVGERFRTMIDETIAGKINSRFVAEDEPSIIQPGKTFFHFGKARNHAASFAKNDMISNQDCDEIYTVFDIDTICKYIAEGYEQFEYNFVFSHDQYGRELIKFLQSKFYNRNKLLWKGVVHEVLQPVSMEEIKRTTLTEKVLKLEHWQNPNTPRGQYLVGLAIDCFENPENDRNSHYFARELLWNGYPKSAIKEFKRHVNMNKWPAEAAQSMIYIGDAYGILDNKDAQIEWYLKAFQTDGTRREALIRLARFYQTQNEPDKVAVYAAAALEIPWNGFYSNHRSHYENEPHELMYWAQGWLGNISRAREHLTKALEYQPYNPMYLEHTKYYFNYGDPGIEGWMRFPELQFLYEAAKNMDTIVEVGSYKGKSTHALCTGCRHGLVTAVDHFLGSNEAAHEGKAIGDQIFLDFLNNMRPFDNYAVHRESSIEAAKKYADKSFDMVFIDAGHTYEDVKADIKAWKNKAKILLCGHDFCNEWPGVRQAVIEELGAVEICDSIWYKYVCEWPKVSIIIPSLGREAKLQRCLAAIKENAGYSNYEIIVEPDSFDNRQGAPKLVQRGVEKSTGELVMFLGNDCIPEKDFLWIAVLKMLRTFPDLDGLVGLNDGYWHGEFATHWLAGKKLLPMVGGEFFHTGYYHTGCDNELTERARMFGKYVWCEEARIFHDHPVQYGFKHEDMDEVYKIAYNPEFMAHDKALLEERSKQFGFSIRHAFTSPRKYPETHTSIDLRRFIKRPETLRVLNIGIGPGNSGLAVQLPFFRFKQLTHIEIHEPYIKEAEKVIWDAEQVTFILGDVREMIDFSDFDLILFFDVIEHLSKSDGYKVLEQLLKSESDIILFAPLEKHFRENVFEAESQDHLSLWTEQEFKNLGFKTEVLPNFHRTAEESWDEVRAILAKKTI